MVDGVPDAAKALHARRGDATHAPRARRLGVIGSFVWDEIHGRDPAMPVIAEWGGIAYSLGALDAALADDWEIVPLAKVGSDLAPQARDFLRTLKRVARDAAPVEVSYPNNRVVLRYLDDARRTETLSGGVPAWSWLGLVPLLRDLDALYVNFISGFELDLDTFRLIRQHFRGPIYTDLHSLTLAVQPDGLRTLAPVPNVGAWCECTDVLQVNEDECALLAPDGLALAATALAAGVNALFVTLGPRGAAYFTSAPPDSGVLSASPSRGPIRTARMPAVPILDTDVFDPTGCGDVWGATAFARLLAGDSLESAVESAHRAASRNLRHRGASGLADHLRGVLSRS